ncbi:hypothetical protein ACFE04_010154 [Oxalis oulophora]
MGNIEPCILTASESQGKEITCEDNIPLTPTCKRKRLSTIVTSDSEGTDEENYNEGQQSCLSESRVREMATPRRRRLSTLRERESIHGLLGNKSSTKSVEAKGNPTNEDSENDESQEVQSDSESNDSLKDFIVDTSDDTSSDEATTDTMDDSRIGGESHDPFGENVEFDEILSKLKRSKDDKIKWELEADMLAAFGKDDELCMKAVCALNRQQDKKISEGDYRNGRGFSRYDESRGGSLGDFLTDGEPQGDLKKSVEELQDYDLNGVEHCRRLAIHYSKKLFRIYRNKEDPYFLPLKR